MPRVAQPHGCAHTHTHHSNSHSTNPTQNLHHLPHKFAFLYASHTQGVPLTFPHFPRQPHPHPTLPADYSLAWNWKLVGTGFVVGNKASCTQASRWIDSIHLSPPPPMSTPNKRKLSSGKWMWGLGAQRKRALEVGRVTSPGSYQALHEATGTVNWQRDRTALPPHRIASIHRKRPKPEKSTLPSAPCPLPTALGATGAPTACNKAPPTQTCSSLFVARAQRRRCRGFCPSAPRSRRRGWEEEQALGEE